MVYRALIGLRLLKTRITTHFSGWKAICHLFSHSYIELRSFCRICVSLLFTIHGHMLQEVDSSKYLGVTISKDLRWDDHINTITAKANRTLGFLRRNMRSCKSSARAAAYQGLVRPTLEYACSTWDPWNSPSVDRFTLVGNSYHHTLFWMEGHLPSILPFFH
jgi:hypothetical protein